MTQATIHETIDQVLEPYRGQIPSEYNGIIVQLLGALETREAHIAADLREFAEGRDLPPGIVDSAFREVGLDVKSPLVAPEDSSRRAAQLAAELDEMMPKMQEMRKQLNEKFGI